MTKTDHMAGKAYHFIIWPFKKNIANLAVTSRAAMNIHAQCLYGYVFSFFFQFLELEYLGCMVDVCLSI